MRIASCTKMVSLKICSSVGIVNFSVEDCYTVDDIETFLGIANGSCYLLKKGQVLSQTQQLQHGETYCVIPRVLGGKGGFGSMLRAIGAQIEKTTNREACRDLIGRRMRDVNNEKKLKEWVAKQAEKERDKGDRRRERRARMLSETSPKFDDPVYVEQCAKVHQDLEQAVTQGLKRKSAPATVTSSSESKKKKEEHPGPSLHKWEWLGIDIDAQTNSSEEDSSSPCDSKHDTDSQESTSMAKQQDSNKPDAQLQESTSITKQCDSHISTNSEDSLNTNSNESVDIDSKNLGRAANQHLLCIEANPQVFLEDSKNLESVASQHSSFIVEKPQASTEDWKNLESVASQHSSFIVEKPQASTEDSKNLESAPSLQLSYIDEKPQTSSKASNSEHLFLSPSEAKDYFTRTNGQQETDGLLVLEQINSAEELALYGLERLKAELSQRGLKCGGTLQERAQRLFAVKGLKPHQIDSSLLAKPSSAKEKKGKSRKL